MTSVRWLRGLANPFGPILRRELLATSRRRSTFSDRAVIGLVFLAALAAGTAWWDHDGRDRASRAGQSRYATAGFGLVLAFGAVMALVSVPNEVAPLIAAERERKTLDALLATRLRSAEVVLGTLAAGLVKQLNVLAVLLAVGVAMVPAWGVDPRLVGLCFAGLGATLVFVGAMSVAASVEQPTARLAVANAFGLALSWLTLPVFARVVLPMLWGWGASATAPVTDVLLESSPAGVALNVGLLQTTTLVDAVTRMVGWELAGAALLLLYAVVRLRPASRGLYDGETRSLIRRLTAPSRPGRRRPCGDDPVLWHETTRRRAKTPAGRVVDRMVLFAALGAVAAAVLWVAVPAFQEVAERGYGPSPPGAWDGPNAAIHMHPYARLLVAGPGLEPPPGTARLELNEVVRPFFAAYLFTFVVAVAGATVELLAAEAERDTWSGLLATPLTGAQILRAKMLGAVWQTRWFTGTALAVCLVGLAGGGLHPVGFAYALALAAVSGWFFTSLGAYAWLRYPDRQRATAAAIFPVLVLAFAGLTMFGLAPGVVGVPGGSVSTPLLAWFGLVSYDDVDAALRKGAFPALDALRKGAFPALDGWKHLGPVGAGRVAVACLLGLALQAAGAFVLTRKALREFDALVGRPARPARAAPVAHAHALPAAATPGPV